MSLCKKINYFFIVLLFSIPLLCYLGFRNTNKLSEFDNFKVLKNGDLILRCGKSTESFAIHLADNTSEFTHIGIISIEKEHPYVIHAVPNKQNILKKETLLEFIDPENNSTYAIYRSQYNVETLSKVVNEAQNFYSKKYTFDNEYDLNTDTKLYCTELILKAFNNAGITLNIKAKQLNFVIGKHNIIFPSEFTKEPEFNRVI